jgi:beta-galactosidase
MPPTRAPQLPPRSGAVHYWRLPRRDWEPALRGLVNLGFAAVETYVPWSVHEVEAGRYDFGELDRRKDVGAFLDLAHTLGLRAIVRPGPHINAELTHFGIPERVLLDPQCQARSPRGNPVMLYFPPRMFPVPSYASEAYLAEVGRWFDAVTAQLAPRIRPHGPVEWVQIDNEAGYYFRNGPYGQDFHPDARAGFRAFVQARHGTLPAAAQAHGRAYGGIMDIHPPERFEPSEALGLHLDWAAFQEHLLTRSLVTMRDRLCTPDLGRVKTFHNISLGEAGLPMSLPALAQELDVVGLDYYHRAEEFETIRRRTLYLAGTTPGAYAPELGAGGPPWFPPMRADESLFCALVACAHGLRSFNAYMAVDRDRWYGAPLDERGQRRPGADEWERLLRALDEVEFEAMQRPARVGIVWPRSYLRLSRATHVYGPFSPSIMEVVSGSPVHGCRQDALGHADVVQVAWWERCEAVAAALTRLRVPFVYVDGDAPNAAWESLGLVIAPTYDFFDRPLAVRLAACAVGGARVVCGPRRPRRDEHGREHAFDELAQARLELLRDPDETLATHATELQLAREPDLGEGLCVTAHVHPRGHRVLFIVNPGSEPRRATLPAEIRASARDLLLPPSQRGPLGDSLLVARQSVRMLLVPADPANGATP